MGLENIVAVIWYPDRELPLESTISLLHKFTHSKKLAGDLEKMAQKSQSGREAVVALESTVKELTRQNDKLESDLAAQLDVSSGLQASLEDQKAQAASIEREFSAYKEEHKLSGDLGALQDAVAVLQDQLREKKVKKKG